jgi:hypothetical protein
MSANVPGSPKVTVIELRHPKMVIHVSPRIIIPVSRGLTVLKRSITGTAAFRLESDGLHIPILSPILPFSFRSQRKARFLRALCLSSDPPFRAPNSNNG